MNRTKIFFEIVALFASVLAIASFFSVKPLPKITLHVQPQTVSEVEGMDGYAVGQIEGSSDQCMLVAGADSIKRLRDSVGQAIYIDLRIGADQWSGAPNDGSGCILNPFNMSDPELQLERPGEFFFHIIGPSFEIEGTDTFTGETFSSESIFDFQMPTGSSFFTQVSHCENHCYMIDGAVRVEPVFESEGIFSIRFQPIDVYQNSHLTARYECRISAESLKFEWLAPLYCGFS